MKCAECQQELGPGALATEAGYIHIECDKNEERRNKFLSYRGLRQVGMSKEDASDTVYFMMPESRPLPQMPKDIRWRPVCSRRARTLRKRGTFVYFDAETRRYVWSPQFEEWFETAMRRAPEAK